MLTALSICMVSDDFLPEMTGVGVHIKLIGPELVRRGHKVCVITTRRAGEPEQDQWQGVTIYRVFTLKAYGFYQALPSTATVRRILQTVKPDLVHHHYVGFMMRQVCVVAEALKLPQVSTFHFSAEVLTQPLPMRPLRGLIRRMMVNFNNRFDLVISPSKNLAQRITKEGVTTPVRYITNPVVFGDTSQVVPAQRTLEFTVLYAGRLGPEKNIGYLIKAFAAILKSSPNAVLWIAGRGPEGAALQALCAQLAIVDKVKFLGFLNHPQLNTYYAACDVFVLPSILETQGLVVLEAMSFARPVIVTRVIDPAEELVDEGVNGFIVDPKSINMLQERLLTLRDDSAMRARMGKAGKERTYVLELEPRLVVDKIITAYNDVHQAAQTRG